MKARNGQAAARKFLKILPADRNNATDKAKSKKKGGRLAFDFFCFLFAVSLSVALFLSVGKIFLSSLTS